MKEHSDILICSGTPSFCMTTSLQQGEYRLNSFESLYVFKIRLNMHIRIQIVSNLRSKRKIAAVSPPAGAGSAAGPFRHLGLEKLDGFIQPVVALKSYHISIYFIATFVISYSSCYLHYVAVWSASSRTVRHVARWGKTWIELRAALCNWSPFSNGWVLASAHQQLKCSICFEHGSDATILKLRQWSITHDPSVGVGSRSTTWFNCDWSKLLLAGACTGSGGLSKALTCEMSNDCNVFHVFQVR